jgi:DNA-binding SARP family transcriptional activator
MEQFLGPDLRRPKVQAPVPAQRFQLLGPVGLWSGAREVELGPARQRSVLAVLLLCHGAPVSTDVLIGRVWGDRPPARARDVLYTYVTRLRGQLGAVRLTRSAGGYAVDVGADAIDICRFNRFLVAADTCPDPGTRLQLLKDALALWRGEPLAGLSSGWLDRTRERLRRQHTGVQVARFELELRLRRHAQVVHELCDLVAAQPTVEPLVGHLMVALYRCGRQAEALAVYRDTRRTLVEQEGLEPGQALRDLERAILATDPALLP